MTPRHVVLTVAGLAVLGLGIYLFIEVKATPATADVPKRSTTRVAARTPDPAPRPDDPRPAANRPTTPIPTPTPTPTPPSGSGQPMLAVDPAETRILPDAKKDAIMSEANKAYDRQDYEQAQQIAGRVLADDPTNVRMLRIMVSSACIDGDGATAQKHYLALPVVDREQMRTRCDRYGVTFTDK